MLIFEYLQICKLITEDVKMEKFLQAIVIFFGINSISHAENWIFVPSRENQCNIQVYYDQSALKDKKLIEKWDVSQSSDCEAAKNKEYLIFESKLDCDKKQITLISQKVYFKDGSKGEKKYKYPSASEPHGTPKLLLNEACSVDKNI